MIPINYLAVLIAAVANMILGALWYGPLFGKPWMKYNDISKEMMKDPAMRKRAKRGYIWMFVASLVTAYVLAHLLNVAFILSLMGAFQLAFWIWLGFVVTTQMSQILWVRKPFNLFVINIGYYLVSLLLMAAILFKMGYLQA